MPTDHVAKNVYVYKNHCYSLTSEMMELPERNNDSGRVKSKIYCGHGLNLVLSIANQSNTNAYGDRCHLGTSN